MIVNAPKTLFEPRPNGHQVRSGSANDDLFAPPDGCFSGSQLIPAHSVPLGGPVPFVGHAVASVKANGQVKLPWFVRRNFSDDHASLFLGMHGSCNCLIGSSTAWWQQLTLALDPHRFGAPQLSQRSASPSTRRQLGFCEEFYRPVEHIKLPAWSRAIAEIGAQVLFVGTGETFEIWAVELALNSSDVNLVALAHAATKLQ